MTDRREFLMLAKPSTGTEEIGGWYISEKLDGMRCFWDGGVTRGHTIDVIPWANIGKGTEAVSTGLWSRYGNVINAPEWFLNELPCCPLDGELYAGRGEFQRTMSVVRKKRPIDSEWEDISFEVFSSPCLDQVFRNGTIKNPNFKLDIDLEDCTEFYQEMTTSDYVHITTDTGAGASFTNELLFLEPWLDEANDRVVRLLAQQKLPEDNKQAWVVANKKAKEIVAMGGEGCILRSNVMPWTPKRVGYVLKMKPNSDAEATVTGGTSGRAGVTGKMLGLMGNLTVLFGTVEFELSGFTDAERKINCPTLRAWAEKNPGKQFPSNLLSKNALQFELGSQITFLYRELSKAGVPKDARFLRKRDSE